jgi:hypothetical protein
MTLHTRSQNKLSSPLPAKRGIMEMERKRQKKEKERRENKNTTSFLGKSK